MKEIWEGGQYDAGALLRCMADYFAQFRPMTGNAYVSLPERLSARDALRGTYFSSLNYDCLFEYAARHLDLTLSYDSREATEPPSMTLWKIHGSCNFLPIGLSASASGMAYVASGVVWEGGIAAVDCSKVRAFVAQSALYPAMAIFMEGKPIHSNPSVIKELQSRWSDAVLSAETVGIIGVRPNPTDANIWEPLAETKAALVVIGNREEYRDWAARFRKKGSMEIVGQRFAKDLSAFSDFFLG